jgi:hypothetical protein
VTQQTWFALISNILQHPEQLPSMYELEEHNLLAAEEALQQIYDTISDKPEKMVKYENTPRPDSV